MLAHSDLFLQPASGIADDSASLGPLWRKLLDRARIVGVDAAYGELLAPWFMVHIPRELTTAIAAAGESSPKMFKLFDQHPEMMTVLPYCKALKAESVDSLFEQGAAYAGRVLSSLGQLADADSADRVTANLITYESILAIDHFATLVSMAVGLLTLQLRQDETAALQHLSQILESEEPSLQRQRAIAADYVGLFYKNAPSGDPSVRRSNRKKALKWMNVALSVLPTDERGGSDWIAIKANIANAYMLPGGKDRTTDAETALRHLEDVMQSFGPGERSPQWAMAHDNLAALYGDRQTGNRFDNLKLAVEHAAQAEQVFRILNLPSDRLKALLNIGRALIEMGPEYVSRKTFAEPEGTGASLGVLDKAEEALRQAERLLDQAQLPGVRAQLYQNLAEVAILRHELLGQDSLEVAQYDLTIAQAAAIPGDALRIAHLAYLAAKLAARRLQREQGSVEETHAALDRAIDLTHRVGDVARSGECLYLRTIIVPDLASRSVQDWQQMEDGLSTALGLLTAGRNFQLARDCLNALLKALWQRQPRSPAEIVEKYRRACEQALMSVGTLRGYRGVFMTHLGAGLAALADGFHDSQLREEALTVLTSADHLVSESEQPTDWAQLQLVLSKIREQIAGDEESRRESQDEDIHRAQAILQSVGETPQFPTFLESVNEGVASSRPDASGRSAARTPRPRYLLDFDFKKDDSILDTIKKLDGLRVLHRDDVGARTAPITPVA